MKILAIEQEIPDVDWSDQEEILIQEAHQAYNLYLEGYLREIYFTEEHIAVLILECENKEKAIEILNKLPLVKNKLIKFDVMQLNPYNGYSRIISKPE